MGQYSGCTVHLHCIATPLYILAKPTVQPLYSVDSSLNPLYRQVPGQPGWPGWFYTAPLGNPAWPASWIYTKPGINGQIGHIWHHFGTHFDRILAISRTFLGDYLAGPVPEWSQNGHIWVPKIGAFQVLYLAGTALGARLNLARAGPRICSKYDQKVVILGPLSEQVWPDQRGISPQNGPPGAQNGTQNGSQNMVSVGGYPWDTLRSH